MNSMTWQAVQWFDLEARAEQALIQECKRLKKEGCNFDIDLTSKMLEQYCPVDDVNVRIMTNEFNNRLKLLH